MFPYQEASWSVVDGAMFIGWGTSLPGWATAISAIICAVVLVIGHMSEAEKAKKFDCGLNMSGPITCDRPPTTQLNS